jgi:hypothetical protein
MWYSETIGTIKTPRALTVDGIQHPANIFTLWTKEELKSLDIYPARVESIDSQYYNPGLQTSKIVDGEYVISYEAVEKDVEELKNNIIKSIKGNTAKLLSPSDWMILRSIDEGNDVPSEWTTYRNDVRAYGNTLEKGVEAFASLEAVRNFQHYEVKEERYIPVVSDTGIQTAGSETETINRTVDKTYWGWPESPDAEADPLHVRYL